MTTERKKINKAISKLKHVPVWVLIILFLISGAVTVLALRQNNKNMIALRSAVYEADKNGVGVEQALKDLREYVHSHMNTNLSSGGNAIKPPIQLKYTYERLTAVENEKVKKANEDLYTQAQRYCEQQIPAAVSGRSRVPCIQDYVTKNTVKPSVVSAALYKFDFVSPSWSSDFAGWSLVITVLLFVILASRLLLDKLVALKLTKDS